MSLHKPPIVACLTRMHSSRMRTGQTLTLFQWIPPPQKFGDTPPKFGDTTPPENLETPSHTHNPPKKTGDPWKIGDPPLGPDHPPLPSCEQNE